MDKIKGTVKIMKRDKTAVCLTINGEDEWFDLDSKIKPEYIIPGSNFEGTCIDEEEGNRILTFIKCDRTKTKEKNEYPIPIPGRSEEERTDMKRMSALKGASRIFEGTGKEDDFKRLTDEIIQFIETGIWTEKV